MSECPTHEGSRTCAACPVQQGECPNCGTFWIIHGTKRYGVKPVSKNAWTNTTTGKDGRTYPVGLYVLNQLSNVVGPSRA